MRSRDYRRLARISLWAKKKTTIQTIIGISFGLILLFPMLFIAIGFYGGFSAEINSNPSYRAMRVSYANLKTVSGQVFCSEEYEKEIDKISGIKNNLKFDYYYINNKYSGYASFSLNGGERKILVPPFNNYNYTKRRFFGLQVIDEECAHKPFLDADYKFVPNPLVAGKPFTKGHSKGEIMVSSKFLYDNNIEAEDIVGSTISFYNHISLTGGVASCSEDTLIPNEEYKVDSLIPYFKDFKIVGVYHSNVYLPQSPRCYSTKYDQTNAYISRAFGRDYFWISSASLGENGQSIAPKRIARQKQESDELVNESWFYYEDSPKQLAEKVTSAGYAFLPIGYGVFNHTNHYSAYTKTQIIEFSSFQAAKFGYDDIYQCYRRSVTGDPDNALIYHYENNIAPKGFFVYQSFFDRFFFLCIGFGVFGSVIFAATLLNLINTLHFSVESMKGFLGICRAQGLKRRNIVRLFFNQISLIFACGYVSTIAIGGGACIGIKILFDRAIKEQITEDSAMNLALRWWYIPIALGVLLVITTALSYIISHLLVRRVNKTPILEILSEEGRM